MLMVLGKKKMKILEISQDKSSIDDKVRNGIFKVKIEFPLDSFNDICYFAGLHWIDGLSALFQISGTPPKCLFCERFGHIKRNCPKLKMLCQKCNKRGHLVADCNLVKAMFGNNDPEDEHDEAFILNLNSSAFNNDNPFLVPGATASAAASLVVLSSSACLVFNWSIFVCRANLSFSDLASSFCCVLTAFSFSVSGCLPEPDLLLAFDLLDEVLLFLVRVFLAGTVVVTVVGAAEV
jgi:hypothetical protein